MRLKIKKTGTYKYSKKYLKLIEEASVYDVAIDSPTTYAPNLSVKEKNNIYLKREDLQPIFSFKNRGAYNKIFNLSEEKKSLGIIAASAGNHAQGGTPPSAMILLETKLLLSGITSTGKGKEPSLSTNLLLSIIQMNSFEAAATIFSLV